MKGDRSEQQCCRDRSQYERGQVQLSLTLAEPGKPVGERQREQEPEENLHAQADYAQFLQQFREIAIIPLSLGFIPLIRTARPFHRVTSRPTTGWLPRHNTAETKGLSIPSRPGLPAGPREDPRRRGGQVLGRDRKVGCRDDRLPYAAPTAPSCRTETDELQARNHGRPTTRGRMGETVWPASVRETGTDVPGPGPAGTWDDSAGRGGGAVPPRLTATSSRTRPGSPPP